ncbi:unnamed protein product [Strongylus vulgaris]|uniref:Uncharacterized protein n=1 Tax=Strongylus vulgaris TaxID=40348 RepID=A0A3P7LNU0_STRVU|nr:unnamed protein product [Strongylus vulgaris]
MKTVSTPTRRSTLGTKRRNFVGLLEEDSVDYVPIVPNDSAKKMKDRMAFLDEDSQPPAVITNLQKEFDLESSQSASTSVTIPLPPMLPEETLKMQSSEQPGGVAKCIFESVKEISDVASDTNSLNNNRRRSKMKLNFDEAMDCSTTEQTAEPNLEISEDSATSSGEASTELSADSDTTRTETVEEFPRSRRSQKKVV